MINTELNTNRKLCAEVERLRQRVKELEDYLRGEPVAVVRHNGLGYPYVDLLGNNGAQYFGLEDGTKLYTSALSIPDGYMLAKRYFCTKCMGAFTTQIHNGCDYMAKDMLAAAPKLEGKK